MSINPEEILSILSMVETSVKHYSHSDAEIVLRTIKQSRRVVVELDHSYVDSVICTNVETATERRGKSSFTLGEICTRVWKDGDAGNVIEVHAIPTVCRTGKRVGEWFECLFRRVVF